MEERSQGGPADSASSHLISASAREVKASPPMVGGGSTDQRNDTARELAGGTSDGPRSGGGHLTDWNPSALPRAPE